MISCPVKRRRFEVKIGKGLGAPITCDVKTYLVRVQGDAIQVKGDLSGNGLQLTNLFVHNSPSCGGRGWDTILVSNATLTLFSHIFAVIRQPRG